jgi:hypothetical protein
MYQIENKDDIFVGFYYFQEYIIRRIGNERDLIKYLAKGYRPYGMPEHSYEEGYDYKYVNHRFSEDFFDGYGRTITPTIYKNDAWVYYVNYIRGTNEDKKEYFYWKKNKVYKGTFRRTSVEGIHKRWRGGPSIRPRHIKPIVAMYKNPEYKEFNRGSHKELPDGWWDDWRRVEEKNWKSQRKTRHQWER